jgi:predicted RNA polymerase sigma factor
MAAKKTPKQLVEERFKTRSALVGKIVKLLDGDAGTKSRLMGTTNKKLLRLHDVATTVKTSFGGKSGLIDAIAAAKPGQGTAQKEWRTKMEQYTVKRLYDVYRQASSTTKG